MIKSENGKMNNQKTNRADLEKQLVGMTFADAEKVGLKWGNDHLPILPKLKECLVLKVTVQ